MSFNLRDLLLYWQETAGLDDGVSAEEMKGRLGALYSSMGYYAQIVPDVEVPPPADAL